MAVQLQRYFFALFLVLSIRGCTAGESSTCLTVYREGGAPAVFRSPKCPRWKLPDYDSNLPRASNCQSAVIQGRRKTQEDRTFCALDVRIPFPGINGITEVSVDIVAVFDGHNGAEASHMASKLLLEYLVLHTYFQLDAALSSELRMPMISDTVEGFARERISYLFQKRLGMSLSDGQDKFFHLEILKESLTRAIRDIDTAFSREAYKHKLGSGSTATVILIVDGQILVANLGDSKALMCSEEFLSPEDSKTFLLRLCEWKRKKGLVKRVKDCHNLRMASNGMTHLLAKDLTSDHRPDRDDEKSRVEMAGGYVLEWAGVPRVNGKLAVSRAIGDVAFKSYGVTSAPEVTDWLPLTSNDSYIVAASDGVFQTLDSQDVCNILWDTQNKHHLRSGVSSLCSATPADCIVDTAFESGSSDNIAAIVVPLRSNGFSNPLPYKSNNEDEDFNYTDLQSEELSSSLVQLGHAHPIVTKFDRLLVEVKQGSFGCFYLSENLKETEDSIFWVVDDEKEENLYDVSQALPAALDLSCHAGHVNLHAEKSMCLPYGMVLDKNKDQTVYPEAFARFFGLLESIPWHISGLNIGSFENIRPSMRYILNKRFGRGAYGEVWLAFHWNCSQGGETVTLNKTNFSTNYVKLESTRQNSQADPYIQDHKIGSSDDNMFILKRIMVEKGPAVYLSGVREIYFGEVFLNASASIGGHPSSPLSKSFFHESNSSLYDLLKRGKVHAEESSRFSNSKNVNKNRTLGAMKEEGLSHIARYVESFESRSNEIWLAFRHEGISLTKLMYTSENNESQSERLSHAQILRPSQWWHWLKTSRAGQEEMRNLVWELLTALKSCHDRNITHRDIKPENMVICIEDPESGKCLLRSPFGDMNQETNMRIIDFGSAIDDFTVKHLYGSAGPSKSEQTYDYTPPEALLNASWYHGPTSRILKYDMWSVGVVMLELVLGSPDVFQISTLSRALLDKHIGGWNEDLKELAYKLRSFMEICILIPGYPTKLYRTGASSDQADVSLASWKCSEEFFSNLIKSRDPLGIGFPNVWAMRLVRQLLLWNPDDRLSVDDALNHPYFQQPL